MGRSYHRKNCDALHIDKVDTVTFNFTSLYFHKVEISLILFVQTLG